MSDTLRSLIWNPKLFLSHHPYRTYIWMEEKVLITLWPALTPPNNYLYSLWLFSLYSKGWNIYWFLLNILILYYRMVINNMGIWRKAVERLIFTFSTSLPIFYLFESSSATVIQSLSLTPQPASSNKRYYDHTESA